MDHQPILAFSLYIQLEALSTQYLSLQLVSLVDGLDGLGASQGDDSADALGDGLFRSDHKVAHVAWNGKKQI